MTIADKIRALINLQQGHPLGGHQDQLRTDPSQPPLRSTGITSEQHSATTTMQTAKETLLDRPTIEAIRELLNNWSPVTLLSTNNTPGGLEDGTLEISSKLLLELMERAGIASKHQLGDPDLLLQKLIDFPTACSKHRLIQLLLKNEFPPDDNRQLLNILKQIANHLQNILVRESQNTNEIPFLLDPPPQNVGIKDGNAVQQLITTIQTISGKIAKDLHHFESQLLKLIKQQLSALPQLETSIKQLLSEQPQYSATLALQDTLRIAPEVINSGKHPFATQLIAYINTLQQALLKTDNSPNSQDTTKLLEHSLIQLQQLVTDGVINLSGSDLTPTVDQCSIGHLFNRIGRQLIALLAQLNNSTATTTAFQTSLTTFSIQQSDLKTLIAPLFEILTEFETSLSSYPPAYNQSASELASLLRTIQVTHLDYNDKPQTRLLEKMMQLADQAIKQEHLRHQTQPTQQKEHQLTKALEQIWRAHEALNQLNTLSQIAGEPIFIFFPTMISGLLTRFEISYQHYAKEQPNQKDKRNRNSKKFEEIRLRTFLPTLKGLNVNLSFRNEELYLTICCQNEIISGHLDSRFPQLEKKLLALGYTKQNLKCMVTETTEVKPTWLTSFIGSSEIIA